MSYADNVIENAKSLFIIGFGFNDEHLTPKIDSKIRAGTPFVVITKKATLSLRKKIKIEAQKYCLLEEGNGGGIKTNIEFKASAKEGDKIITLDENFWSLKGVYGDFMSEYEDVGKKPIGTVESVDTGNIIIKVFDEQVLNSVQVNNLIEIRSTKTGEAIIGLVIKIMRKYSDKVDENSPDKISVENIIKASLVGDNFPKAGYKTKRLQKKPYKRFQVFKRIVFL